MWLLEIDLPYKSKYERIFNTEKEALIEHMYLESEGLDVSEWSIREINPQTGEFVKYEKATVRNH
jgi:hypothetical protein